MIPSLSPCAPFIGPIPNGYVENAATKRDAIRHENADVLANDNRWPSILGVVVPLDIVSSTFLQEIKRRRSEFSKGLSAVLKLTPAIFWVYMQEHGTASMGDRGGKSYNIYSKAGNPLRWVDEAGFHMRDVIRDHPGIPAQHFVAQAQEDICKELATVIMTAIVESGWQYDDVKEAFLGTGMKEVKAHITTAIELHIEKKAWRVGFGKLKDTTPADEFAREAYVEDRG